MYMPMCVFSLGLALGTGFWALVATILVEILYLFVFFRVIVPINKEIRIWTSTSDNSRYVIALITTPTRSWGAF